LPLAATLLAATLLIGLLHKPIDLLLRFGNGLLALIIVFRLGDFVQGLLEFLTGLSVHVYTDGSPACRTDKSPSLGSFRHD
jgi:hypothetical protein